MLEGWVEVGDLVFEDIGVLREQSQHDFSVDRRCVVVC